MRGGVAAPELVAEEPVLVEDSHQYHGPGLHPGEDSAVDPARVEIIVVGREGAEGKARGRLFSCPQGKTGGIGAFS